MAENDVFSALNVGSGLNTTELIKNLIEAERAPKCTQKRPKEPQLEPQGHQHQPERKQRGAKSDPKVVSRPAKKLIRVKS